MEMIYISHPYTGNEKENRKDADRIATELAKKHPHILFVNPLDTMRHLKNTNIFYEDVLAKCKTFLAKCDGIIMTGDWKDSYGCMEEYIHANSLNITLWESVEEFDSEHIMPNDCCGDYVQYSMCHCRICAERNACWNCNDCTLEDNGCPVGYTDGDGWQCSRFRKQE